MKTIKIIKIFIETISYTKRKENMERFMQTTYSKKFKTIEEQVQLLKDRGLKFGNEEIAKDLLLKNNYFDLINGFETLLLESSNVKNKKFLDNVYFEQFVKLYNFDKLLSSVLFKAIESFENRLKTSVAYRFSESVFTNNPKMDPGFYMNVLMYDNPYSIQNRIRTLPTGKITQKFVDDINYVISKFINLECPRIQNKVNQLNTITLQYITTKSRNRVIRAINNFNQSISRLNIVTTNANTDINLTPTVRGTGSRVLNIVGLQTNLQTSFTRVQPNVVNSHTLESEILKYLKELKNLQIRVDKLHSQIAVNNNSAIHNVSNLELQNFVGHNIFKTDHNKPLKLNYNDSMKLKYSYLQSYEVPPFWVIIKTLELGSLLKLMYGLKDDVLGNVTRDMGLLPTERHILLNSIKIIIDLRNHCAHFNLANRFRTKPNIRINADLINKLNLKTKSDGASHYELRLYDTLLVLSQFTNLNDASSLFKNYFTIEDYIINSKVLLGLLERMGNENFLDWCDL